MGVYEMVDQEERLVKYCSSLLGYGYILCLISKLGEINFALFSIVVVEGYFGDIAYRSSKLRFLGPFRYIYAGKIWLNQSTKKFFILSI
jgi:hypothetical protein